MWTRCSSVPKKLLRMMAPALLAAALAAPMARVSAAPYPSEAQMRDALEAVGDVARGEGLQLLVLDARKNGVTRPLMAAGLSTANGDCLVFYNYQPSDLLLPFFGRMAEADVPVWLRAIAVHEITHCIEQREAYVLGRFDRILPPDMAHEGMTLQGYVSVLRSGSIERWGEALADIAAVLWLQKAVPGDWRRFAAGLLALRDELSERNPSHSTGPWLQGLLRAGEGAYAERSMFETAFRLRGALRPR
jgi:hypothetical protein